MMVGQSQSECSEHTVVIVNLLAHRFRTSGHGNRGADTIYGNAE
jgi:hypothetical protein